MVNRVGQTTDSLNDGIIRLIPLSDPCAYRGVAMSDKADSKPSKDAPAADKGHGKEDAGAKPKGAGLMAKTPVLLGAVMLIEAVVLIGGIKFVGGGAKKAEAVELVADGAGEHGEKGEKGDGKTTGTSDSKSAVELQLVDFRTLTKSAGKLSCTT